LCQKCGTPYGRWSYLTSGSGISCATDDDIGPALSAACARNVVADLRADHRCVVPTLPLGGHRRPMHPDADLSLSGMVGLVADYLDRLDLREVTLVGNDWGGAQLFVTQRRHERLGRLVLAACEAFDTHRASPAGWPGCRQGRPSRPTSWRSPCGCVPFSARRCRGGG
jgi:pimeloyl-ACP methyl ester carboxylesterase